MDIKLDTPLEATNIQVQITTVKKEKERLTIGLWNSLSQIIFGTELNLII